MMKILLALAMLGAAPLAAAADVSKEDIKKLAAAGISDEVILTYIRTHGPARALSADDLVELKRAGVSDRVLATLAGTPAPAEGTEAEKRIELVDRNVYVPSTPYLYEPTPTVFYYGTSYYGSYWPYHYSIWPTYYYPRYSYPYPRYSYPRSQPHVTVGYSQLYNRIHTTTPYSPAPRYSPSPRTAPAPAPSRTYSSIRTGTKSKR